ncbi:recombinase family protein [Chryseobacterium rhizosphaerae]|nr:recombinase family protein [Chryseobacterium rhizosphaerae]MDC8102322.1 recombinase family protein [Chryseobacterium rhizosphaerae]
MVFINGKFIIQIFGAVAEFERNLISERTKDGLEGRAKKEKTFRKTYRL